MSQPSPEIAEAIATVLKPHDLHPYGSCFTLTTELCEDCCCDSAIAISAAVERERLRGLVLAFAQNKMHACWHADLAKLFEAAVLALLLVLSLNATPTKEQHHEPARPVSVVSLLPSLRAPSQRQQRMVRSDASDRSLRRPPLRSSDEARAAVGDQPRAAAVAEARRQTGGALEVAPRLERSTARSRGAQARRGHGSLGLTSSTSVGVSR